MVEIIKWEGIRQYKILKNYILCYLVAFLVYGGIGISGIENNSRFLLREFPSLVSVAIYVGLEIYIMFHMIIFFTGKSYQFIRSTGKNSGYQLLAMILYNIVLFIGISAVAYLENELTKRYFGGEGFFIELNMHYSRVFVELAIVLPILWVFAYMVGAIIPGLKQHRMIGSVVLVMALSSIPNILGLTGDGIIVFELIGSVVMFAGIIKIVDGYFEQS